MISSLTFLVAALRPTTEAVELLTELMVVWYAGLEPVELAVVRAAGR